MYEGETKTTRTPEGKRRLKMTKKTATSKKAAKKVAAKTEAVVIPAVEPLVDPGKWAPICLIASAQDVDESGKVMVSQSKAMLEQHTGTMAIRTTKV